MSKEKIADLQKWINSNNYTDVRFYPENPSAISSEELTVSAANAVKAYKNGDSVQYHDPIETSILK